MGNPVLLVIDMQLGNFEGSNPIYKGEILLNKIQQLIKKVRKAKIQIIFVQHNGGKGDPDEFGTSG